jgi:hypothetical protein
MQLASRLADVEAGRGGPSVAELSMRAAADDAQRRTLSMAAGGTGSSGAGGMIAAMNANAAQQGQLVRDVGVQRAAEIATARGQLGGVLTDARGQTIQGAQAAGQIADAYGRQTEFAAQNEQATRAQNDAARFQYDALAQDYAARESARRTGAEQFRVGAVQQDDALRSGQYSATLGAEAQRDAATVGMVGTGLAAGAMLAASDVRSKEKIAPADAVGALERAALWLESGKEHDVLEAGARRLAMSLARGLQLALLCEHAQWMLDHGGDRRGFAAALRYSRLPVDMIHEVDPELDRLLLSRG